MILRLSLKMIDLVQTKVRRAISVKKFVELNLTRTVTIPAAQVTSDKACFTELF
jgi:hypothetical protein